MRDMDILNRTSILKNAKNSHKMAYRPHIKPISAQLPFPRAFTYFTKVNLQTTCIKFY